MKRSTRWIVLTAVAVVVAALWTAWRFERDTKVAYTKAAQGSPLVDARCGPIEYQEAGAGTPLLMVLGSGGGYDQVIGYVLATPPEQVSDASPEERARINNMLDHILPVSARAAGLRSDSVLGKISALLLSGQSARQRLSSACVTMALVPTLALSTWQARSKGRNSLGLSTVATFALGTTTR